MSSLCISTVTCPNLGALPSGCPTQFGPVRSTLAALFLNSELFRIEVIFVIGFKPADTDLQMKLVRENRKYGDMLQYCGSDLFK